MKPVLPKTNSFLFFFPFLKPWADNGSTNQYSCQLFYDGGWHTLCRSISKCTLWERGLVKLLQPWGVSLIWLTDIKCLVKTSKGAFFLPPFWCLCQKLSLSLQCFNKISLHKSSERSSLITGPRLNSFPPEGKNPSVFHGLQQPFNPRVCARWHISPSTISNP